MENYKERGLKETGIISTQLDKMLKTGIMPGINEMSQIITSLGALQDLFDDIDKRTRTVDTKEIVSVADLDMKDFHSK